MSKNACASCEGLNVESIIKTNSNKLPEWLDETDYVTEFIQSKQAAKMKPYHQKKYNMKLELFVGKAKAGKYILYWGAQSSTSIHIKNAKQAYGNFKNNGISLINKDGYAILYFNCPQAYSTTEKNKKKKETFYRHIHFCFSDKHKTKWLTNVYTKVIVCIVSVKQTLQSLQKGSIVLLNTLPSTAYAKSHIPNSFNLHYKQIKKMSTDQLVQWFRYVVKINYPKLHSLLKQKKINYYELPIVVYCGNKNCSLSHKASIELLKKGFVNISECKGGMEEYIHSTSS